MPLAVAKATGVYPATFRERVVPAEKPANPLFLCCAPGRSQGRSGAVRWSGGLSRRPNGSRTVRPPSRWRVPQTANPGRLPCQGPPYLAVARQRPQTDTDISNISNCHLLAGNPTGSGDSSWRTRRSYGEGSGGGSAAFSECETRSSGSGERLGEGAREAEARSARGWGMTTRRR